MPFTTLNLGILAHIDAGKTSLTERLLFDNGAIDELGSVDAGSTRTDTGELERERGITIRSAVATFAVRDLQINLVDTPGHPDFVAEVERALSVLDAAVLVLSAVEGVQAQTRVLMKSLRRMRLPTVIFINKIDRMGARTDELLADIRRLLAPGIVPISGVRDPGTPRARAVPLPLSRSDVCSRTAEVLAENDEALLALLVEGRMPAPEAIRALLAAQTAAGLVHPVLFGSALSGAGTAHLTAAIRALVGPPAADVDAPVRGTVFAVERTGDREKVAYLRLFAGELRERQRVTFHRDQPGGATGEYSGRITRLDLVAPRDQDADPGTRGGGAPTRRPLTAGSIARVRGLPGIQVGDRLGEVRDALDRRPHFPPPSLETVVRPAEPGDEARLHAALTALADEDPLIRTRSTGDGTTSVLLYGAVQREVIAERLRRDFGVEAEFAPVTPVHRERPVGTGDARDEPDPLGDSPIWATVGLRVEPGAFGSGIRFVREVEWGALPRAFHRAVEETVLRTLQRGLHGWEVTDCVVTLFEVAQHSPLSTAADFRKLTPLVLTRALRAAGTQVYEPCQHTEIELPANALNAVSGFLATIGADIHSSAESGASWLLVAEVPVRSAHRLTAALPGLTHGEGAAWTRPGRDRRVRGEAPARGPAAAAQVWTPPLR